jgi:hypothetical protein
VVDCNVSCYVCIQLTVPVSQCIQAH